MLGLIFKLIAGFAFVLVTTLGALNAADVAKPGTISLSPPSVEPCRRALAGEPVEYVHVRWVWHAKAYGWGCFFEYSDGSTGTIAPMPQL